jgi:GGDEF domain-containing protein/PAS domain-containing protein
MKMNTLQVSLAGASVARIVATASRQQARGGQPGLPRTRVGTSLSVVARRHSGAAKVASDEEKDPAVKRPPHGKASKDSANDPLAPDLATIIGGMPAAVVLLRERRSIAEVSGRYASVFGRPVVELLGSDLLRFVTPGDSSLVGSVIQEARSMAVGSVPSSVVARFEQPDGSRRLVEVSAAHRADGSARGSTVVLLRPQSVRHGLNAALIPHVGWQDSDDQGSAMQLADEALETIVGVLNCEPVAHECYFLTIDEASDTPVQCPALGDLAEAPKTGPWDAVLAGNVGSVETDVAGLSAELRDFALRRRFATLRCFPVLASHRDRVVACLVAWDRRDEPLSSATEATFRYATEIASLAIGRARVLAPVVAEPLAPWPRDVDVVTGLPLEEALVRSLDEMIVSGQRPGVVCIRLTALAGLVETLGSFTTDQLIRVAARRLHSLIRQTDEVYRVGPDSLAVICTGSLDGERLEDIGNRMRVRLGAPFRVDTDSPVDVGVAISVGQSPENPVAGSELLATVLESLL